MSLSERRDMIRKENTDLSLTRQCKRLKISRSSIYYTPVGFNHTTVDLMHEIDRIFTKYPFFGSRQIAAYLPQSGSSGPPPRAPPDRHHGVAGRLQGAEHQHKARPAQDLAILAEKVTNHAAQSCLVRRHYLHPCQERLFVSCGNHGLGDAQGVVLAAVKYVGCQLLR